MWRIVIYLTNINNKHIIWCDYNEMTFLSNALTSLVLLTNNLKLLTTEKLLKFPDNQRLLFTWVCAFFDRPLFMHNFYMICVQPIDRSYWSTLLTIVKLLNPPKRIIVICLSFNICLWQKRRNWLKWDPFIFDVFVKE